MTAQSKTFLAILADLPDAHDITPTPRTDAAIAECPDTYALYHTHHLQGCSIKLELSLARANRHIAALKLALNERINKVSCEGIEYCDAPTGRRMEINNPHKHAPLAVVEIDCRTCIYWTGKDCNNNSQCIDADLYQQISNVIQIWKRSEE